MHKVNFGIKKNQSNKVATANLFRRSQDLKITQYLFLILALSLLIHIVCMNSAVLLVEEAYYWNYAQHLDFSYLDHPPMVALLIKVSTTLFGNTEFGVRAVSLFCWILLSIFSYKLAQLINKGSGPYALGLLAILPFYFLHTQIITPDVPLIVCWSASLYCLYRSLVLNESNYWYFAGIWLGLGMLSKYTIALLGVTTFFYVLSVSSARYWLRRKEPYLCALIALLIFSPVIYWNATHEWVSFIFQSSRRIVSTSSVHIHHLIGLSLFFLMPIGMYGFWQLMKKKSEVVSNISVDTKLFIRMFTIIPLAVFALFSINHAINFNWIGPIFLALLPWLAALISNNHNTRLGWLKSCVFLLGCYCAIIAFAYFHKSVAIQEKLLKNVIAWDNLTRQFHELAMQIETKTNRAPTFVPLDSYHIGSEFSFYQAKLKDQGKILKTYPIVGSHIFGNNSLMYRYWSNDADYLDKPLILIATNRQAFANIDRKTLIIDKSEPKQIVAIGQGRGVKSTSYYYKVAEIKRDTQ